MSCRTLQIKNYQDSSFIGIACLTICDFETRGIYRIRRVGELMPQNNSQKGKGRIHISARWDSESPGTTSAVPCLPSAL